MRKPIDSPCCGRCLHGLLRCDLAANGSPSRGIWLGRIVSIAAVLTCAAIVNIATRMAQ